MRRAAWFVSTLFLVACGGVVVIPTPPSATQIPASPATIQTTSPAVSATAPPLVPLRSPSAAQNASPRIPIAPASSGTVRSGTESRIAFTNPIRRERSVYAASSSAKPGTSAGMASSAPTPYQERRVATAPSAPPLARDASQANEIDEIDELTPDRRRQVRQFRLFRCIELVRNPPAQRLCPESSVNRLPL